MSALTKQILNRLQSLGDSEVAAHSQRFFKTGPGEYGEGDIFLGIRVPVLRACLRDYRWMLREVGKRDQAVLEGLLSRHSLHMPRTMLRYAIEKLPEDKRLAYLRGPRNK